MILCIMIAGVSIALNAFLIIWNKDTFTAFVRLFIGKRLTGFSSKDSNIALLRFNCQLEIL